jgi:putative oxidoreductase
MSTSLRSKLLDTGLLILRLAVAVMMGGHGWGKLTTFSEAAEGFPDPIGLGSTFSMALAIFAEFFCSILVGAGFLTRLAVIPLITTMAVAALIVHAEDPWNVKERAVLFAAVYITLLLTGPGRFSVDALVWKPRRTTA